ncbi:MAG: hypothetical protein MI863_19895 [Desulfobacterales bacterium]|nr:hypothetical protein [Desulfobacterales bacterium]
MVFDYKILPVKKEDLDSAQRIQGFSDRRKSVSRKFKRDRRKSTQDRRKSVRDGVIVSLSFKNNRRKGGDRRKPGGSRRPLRRGSGFFA